MPHPQTHSGPLSMPSRHRAHKQSWCQAWVLASPSTAGPASPWPPDSLCVPSCWLSCPPDGASHLSPHRVSLLVCISLWVFWSKLTLALSALLSRPQRSRLSCHLASSEPATLHGVFDTSLLRVDGKEVVEEGATLTREGKLQC